MLHNRAIHYEFMTGRRSGHAVGVTRVRVFDNGRVRVNFMNPSGVGGSSTTHFRRMHNIFSITPF